MYNCVRYGSRGRQRGSGGVDGTKSVAGEPVALVLATEAVEETEANTGGGI